MYKVYIHKASAENSEQQITTCPWNGTTFSFHERFQIHLSRSECLFPTASPPPLSEFEFPCLVCLVPASVAPGTWGLYGRGPVPKRAIDPLIFRNVTFHPRRRPALCPPASRRRIRARPRKERVSAETQGFPSFALLDGWRLRGRPGKFPPGDTEVQHRLLTTPRGMRLRPLLGSLFLAYPRELSCGRP
ncbi:hypothetical protein VUR80DRAFT_8519 [Thermomyces stellatus]